MADAYYKSKALPLVWNDPTGRRESHIWSHKENRYRKMTDAEHAKNNRGEYDGKTQDDSTN